MIVWIQSMKTLNNSGVRSPILHLLLICISSTLNLVSCEEILATINAPNIKSITFKCCTSIPNEIGYILHQQSQDKLINHLATLVFIECSFNNTNTIRENVHFATELANLTSIKSFLFTSCSFDDIEQSMCLLWCLNEEIVTQVDVHITWNNELYEVWD